MNLAKRIAIILHWMNFDTAIGAAITSLFVAGHIGSTVPNMATVALILAILSIYNFDHLIDAKKTKGVGSSARRQFYQNNITLLAVYQLLLLIALLFVSWFLPPIIAKTGVVLAVITLIYFLLLFIILPNRFALKEIMIAAVFACGVFLSPIAVSSLQVITLNTSLLWFEIFLLALANTLILSWFDFRTDLTEVHSSLTQILGDKTIYMLTNGILALLAVIIILSLSSGSGWDEQSIIFSMGLVLLISLLFNKRIHNNDALRVAVEAIFLIPAIMLF